MEAFRSGKTTRDAFISLRGMHLFALAIGAAVCLSLTLVHTHPAPKDSPVAEKLESEALNLAQREHIFAVMDQDVSAIELVVHDYNTESREAESYNIYISSGSVADALDKAGIVLNEFDEISIDDSAQVHSGMEINITRVEVGQEYEYEPLP